MVNLVLVALLIYVVVGIVFSFYFVTRGVAKLDPTAAGAPVGFRVLIFPGSAALWPLLLVKTATSKPSASQGGSA